MAEPTLLCPQCHNKVARGQPFCSFCGSRIGTPEMDVPVCGNCGATVEPGGAFCWKCGVPLSTGHTARIPSPAPTPEFLGPEPTPAPWEPAGSSPTTVPMARGRGDGGTRSELVAVGRRPASIGAVVAIVLLVVAFGVFSGLYFTGELDKLTGRAVVYVDGVNESGEVTVSGTPVAVLLKVGCGNCPISGAPGSQMVLNWEVSNEFTSNLTYTQFGLTPGAGWSGQITPSAPFSLAPGQVQPMSLVLTAPSSSGSYFAPVTLTAIVN